MTQDLVSQSDVLPNGEALPCYLRSMHLYYENQERFSKEGFTFSTFEKIKRLAQLSVWDLWNLFSYAKRIPSGGTYLEIGSHLGGSLLCAYEATRASDNSVNFIAIQPVVTEELLSNTEAIPHFRLIKSKSDMAKDEIENNSIDLLFIDGDHSYEQCKRDIENYWPKLKKGGVLLGHDYRKTTPGVIRAVNEIFAETAVTLFKNCMMWSVPLKETDRIDK